MSRDRLRCIFVVFPYVNKVFYWSPSRVPVSRMYNFLQRVQVMVHVCSRWHWLRYRWNDWWSWWIAWVLIFSQHYKWKEMFCFMCAHLKVPGWSFVCNALLTKSYLQCMFLSCLNEISGGCKKILPVSGYLWSSLKCFRMMDFTAWLWGWNVRVNDLPAWLSSVACYTKIMQVKIV